MTKRKIVFLALGLPAGLVLLAIIFFYAKIKYDSYIWYKKTDAFLSALQAPFRADTYGGKTPEETTAKLIDDLKSNKLEEASLLYDVLHQKQAYQKLVQIKDTGRLDQWIKNLQTLEKDKIQSGSKIIYYSYKYFDSETHQYLWAPMSFYLNPLTHIWKIVY